nr:phosphofructokinase homolog - Bacillus psychrophilus [Sporosarcina psychrophila]
MRNHVVVDYELTDVFEQSNGLDMEMYKLSMSRII